MVVNIPFKSSISMGFSIINHAAIGVPPLYGNLHKWGPLLGVCHIRGTPIFKQDAGARPGFV